MEQQQPLLETEVLTDLCTDDTLTNNNVKNDKATDSIALADTQENKGQCKTIISTVI